MSRSKFDLTVSTLAALMALPLCFGVAASLGLDGVAAVVAPLASIAVVGALAGVAPSTTTDEVQLAPGRLAVADNSRLFCKSAC